MKNLPPKQLDLRPFVDRKVAAHENKIAWLALEKLFPGEVVDRKQLTVDKERVKNHFVKITTVRYRGEILFRRFMASPDGMELRYESPIYDNLNNE